MATDASRRIALFVSFGWAMASFGMSIAPLLADAEDMAAASAYHDMRHALLDSAPESGTERESVAYFDQQWASLNRTRASHAGTSLLLALVSGFALNRLRRDQVESIQS